MSAKPPRDPRCPPKRSQHDCPAPINPCTIGQPKQKKQVKQVKRTEDDEDCEPEEELDCGDDEPTCLDVLKEEQAKAAKLAAKAAAKKDKKGSAASRVVVDDDDDDDDEDAGVCAPSKQPTCRDTATKKEKPC